MYGLQTGAILAVAMIAVAWIKSRAFDITIEAMVAFVVGGLLGVAGARAEWNKLESIYPDIGTTGNRIEFWTLDLVGSCHEQRRPA
jgi:hypothetical protein